MTDDWTTTLRDVRRWAGLNAQDMEKFYGWWLAYQTPVDVFYSLDRLETMTTINEMLLRCLTAPTDADRLRALASLGARFVQAFKDAAYDVMQEALDEVGDE